MTECDTVKFYKASNVNLDYESGTRFIKENNKDFWISHEISEK